VRWTRSLLVAAALIVVCAACDFPNIDPPGAAPLRYRDQIFTSDVVTTNITYGSATDLSGNVVTLQLDLYTPPPSDTDTQRPAVIWVHGGSFCCGDKTSPELIDEATTFAEEGYVNVSINYRLEPGGCSAANPTATCVEAIQEATADAQTAVSFLRTNAATYGIDPTRIAIGGSSAGAITALQVGYLTAETPESAVRAAVSLSGANILETIGPGDAPALLFHGTADHTVPYAWAVATRDAAVAAGVPVYLETLQGAGHVPYVQYRSQILHQTRNFLYWEMDLAHAS
jgi:acetyl esterase/lipase